MEKSLSPAEEPSRCENRGARQGDSGAESRPRWLKPVLFATGGLASATLAAALYIADALTHASKATSFDSYGFTPFEMGVPWVDVQIPTTRGDSLSGWWLPRPETKQVILVCYGYRNRKSDMVGLGATLWRHGYNVLIFDYHGHGEHVGTRVTLGYREMDDALTAADFVFTQVPEARLGAVGYSMGAAIAIMAAARDERIEAVVADSPFAAQRNPILRRIRSQLHLSWGGRVVLVFTDLLLHWQLGYHFRDVEPIRDIKRLGQRPILFIHGTDDKTIDPQDSALLYDAATGPKELWKVEGVDHCGAYFADRAYYVERICGFLDGALHGDRVADSALKHGELEEHDQRHDKHEHQDRAHRGNPGAGSPGHRLLAIPRLHRSPLPSPAS